VEMLERACAMARRWVGVKGARYSTDFSKLGLEPLPRGRLAQVAWARARGTG
jgi:16S rRNA (guanine1516-N2)-methyltransferase